MEIRVVDFDVLTKNYSNYQNGVQKMEEVRKSFVSRMDPIKGEMESIIKSVNNGLIVDRETQEEKNAKFSELQEQAMAIDNEYKMTMRLEQENLNKSTYDELETIINEWAQNKDVDMVMGKMEVVFAKGSVEITEEIIETLKEKGLYQEFKAETVEKKNIVVEDLR